MDEYIECAECAFVLLADSMTAPEPARVESCPNCGGTDFRFVDDEPRDGD